MSIVVLDAMENGNGVSGVLKSILENRGEELSLFNLRSMNILPCRACGACSYKSPGKCTAKDDIHDIHRAIAKSNTIIMLTTIRFGGYPSCLKKAVDKFMHLCLPTYTVKYGHLLHPARYGSKSLIGIGMSEGNSKDQEESFKRLLENNALNLQYTHKVLILNPSVDMEKVSLEISNMLTEVC